MNTLKIIIPLLITIILISGGCQKQDPYSRGNEYLKNKQYTEAISEFQKVEPGEKNFRLAQSKINFIQGLLSFNDSLFGSAGLLLYKVEKDDEYYHESQLMLDKINQRKFAPEKKDTVIVKHETVNPPVDKSGTGRTEKEPKPSDDEINRKYIKQAESLIEKFESLYQSARTASLSVKPDYINNMNKVLGELEALSYEPTIKNAKITDLKQKTSAWMNKRIAFINRLISENSVTETNTSRSLKEEGDKMYAGVKQQLKAAKQ